MNHLIYQLCTGSRRMSSKSFVRHLASCNKRIRISKKDGAGTQRLLSSIPHKRLPQLIDITRTRIVSCTEIKEFFDEKKLYYEQGYTSIITTCPSMLNDSPSTSELEKLYVNKNTGDYVCNHCQSKGAWFRLRDCIGKLQGRPPSHVMCPLKSEELSAIVEKENSINTEVHQILSTCEHISQRKSTKQLLARFGIKEIYLETLSKFNVHVSDNDLVLPYYDRGKTVHGIKMVSSVRKSAKSHLEEKTLPKRDFHGLFGYNLISKDHTEVILTLSEFDAMIVHQETSCASLSLSKGALALHPQVLPILEQFDKIILWFGNDVTSWETAKHFAKKLNEDRCYILGPSYAVSGPLSCKKNGIRLQDAIQRAMPVRSKSITSFHELRGEVYSELSHTEQVAGLQWERFPQLNKLLKGHRRGELTVLTGTTGSGKTTFISEYSLDLCINGVQTLWGSFEIKNVRLMKMMLTQFSRMNLSKNLAEFDGYADKFAELPMFFMTFHGQENITKVIETMSHAVYMYDIAHIVVDNLQFMMGVDASRLVLDRFTRQDQVIAAFRKFATIMNCHVTLVIHPRKEEEGSELTTSSIFGGAKASQESDNILLLQSNKALLKGKKYLQVAKNRFDGDLGAMLLKFDKESLCFSSKIQKPKSETHEQATEIQVSRVSSIEEPKQNDISTSCPD